MVPAYKADLVDALAELVLAELPTASGDGQFEAGLAALLTGSRLSKRVRRARPGG
jgi:hypothetical protein